MKKRSIYRICEHFEDAHNAVSGGYIYFEIACNKPDDIIQKLLPTADFQSVDYFEDNTLFCFC